MRDYVSEMFDHAFDSYITHGFPSDEVKPISCRKRIRKDPTIKNTDYREFILGNYSLTLVDALDSLVVFNRTEDFVYYSNWLIENLDFDTDVFVSVFEVNIRILGGLLSAHGIQERLQLIPDYNGGLLAKAKDIGDRLA
jgi:mannosidase alpha-like ER degradation enhancer 3